MRYPILRKHFRHIIMKALTEMGNVPKKLARKMENVKEMQNKLLHFSLAGLKGKNNVLEISSANIFLILFLYVFSYTFNNTMSETCTFITHLIFT